MQCVLRSWLTNRHATLPHTATTATAATATTQQSTDQNHDESQPTPEPPPAAPPALSPGPHPTSQFAVVESFCFNQHSTIVNCPKDPAVTPPAPKGMTSIQHPDKTLSMQELWQHRSVSHTRSIHSWDGVAALASPRQARCTTDLPTSLPRLLRTTVSSKVDIDIARTRLISNDLFLGGLEKGLNDGRVQHESPHHLWQRRSLWALVGCQRAC